MTRRDALLRLLKSLLARRAALRDTLATDLDGLRDFPLNQSNDSAEAAFHSEREEISTQLAELERHELIQVERALTRLKQGRYGTCEVCQGKIPVARLNAQPYVTCQREMEGRPGGESRRSASHWENIQEGEPATEEHVLPRHPVAGSD
jgi:DnaK suppressor protein